MTTDWVPDACTLPTAEQPIRVAEFANLLTTGLHDIDRPSANHLRLRLTDDRHAEAVRLAEAESDCCSFFTFTVSDPADGLVTVDIQVPDSRADVLDGLASMASGEQRVR